MAINHGYGEGVTIGDWLSVAFHGIRLDSVTACYLLLVPILITFTSLFCKTFTLRKWLRPYYVLIAILLSVIFIADIVMYQFWGAKIDANDLMYAEKPKEMLASVSVWFILLGIATIGLVAFHYFRRLSHATPQQTGPRPNGFWSLLLIPLLGLLFIGMRGGTGTSTANPSYAYHFEQPYLNHATLNPAFNMIHSLFKVDDLSAEFQFYSDEDLQRLTQGTYYQDATVETALLNQSRPNILLIIWEGGGSQIILNDSVGSNYEQLRKEGVFFSNCYANNMRTDRGLVSILNGWPGLPTTSLMKSADKSRKLPALARELQKVGYATEFIYGGDADFTNMRCHLNESGFSNIYGIEHFPNNTEICNWGIPDKYILTLPYTTLSAPYFSTILTLSSHEPWDVDFHKLQNKQLNAFAYTDSCLGAFITQLKHSKEWDNLLVIIIPDHGVALFDNQYPSDYEVAKIPMLWIGGAIKHPAEITRLMNQSDLPATLLAQLGLDNSAFFFSRNILGTTYKQHHPFAVHAYKKGFNYIDTTGVTSFDCVDESSVAYDTVDSAQRLERAKANLQLIYRITGQL